MSKADEPAFPHFTYEVVRTIPTKEGPPIILPVYVAEGGLTKREYFAGLAMQGELAATAGTFSSKEMLAAYVASLKVKGFGGAGEYYAYTASEAVKYADALLAELSKNQRPTE